MINKQKIHVSHNQGGCNVGFSKNQFGIIVLADYYSIFIMNMALRGGEEEMIVQFMIRLPADLRASIKDRAKAMGLSANALILKVLWDYFGK